MAQNHAKALNIYRKIWRTANTWKGPPIERDYIKKECRSLFEKNRNLSDPLKIEKKLFEAETRLELGLHYKNPYPRMYHAPPHVTPKELREEFIPGAYMDSYFEKSS